MVVFPEVVTVAAALSDPAVRGLAARGAAPALVRRPGGEGFMAALGARLGREWLGDVEQPDQAGPLSMWVQAVATRTDDGFALGNWLNFQRHRQHATGRPTRLGQQLTAIDTWWDPPWPVAWQRMWWACRHHLAGLPDGLAWWPGAPDAEQATAWLGEQQDRQPLPHPQQQDLIGQLEALAGKVPVWQPRISDTAWHTLSALLPPPSRTGGRCRSERQILEAIVHIACTRQAWRRLPQALGPFRACRLRYLSWLADDTLDLITTTTLPPADQAWQQTLAHRLPYQRTGLTGSRGRGFMGAGCLGAGGNAAGRAVVGGCAMPRWLRSSVAALSEGEAASSSGSALHSLPRQSGVLDALDIRCESARPGRRTRDRGGVTPPPGLLRTAPLQGETTSSLIGRIASRYGIEAKVLRSCWHWRNYQPGHDGGGARADAEVLLNAAGTAAPGRPVRRHRRRAGAGVPSTSPPAPSSPPSCAPARPKPSTRPCCWRRWPSRTPPAPPGPTSCAWTTTGHSPTSS
ncbi:transposase [Streptomyces phaeoluteigriseus]|uniref:transposase n=1 Tax=Streptomyces phaeoluteigriseus TaxID=114686 RepID=UPI00338EF6AF